MNTDYAIGSIRIHFESRTRRRWFVAFFYSVLAASDLVWFSIAAKYTASAWISVGCMIVFVLLSLVFTWIAGDMRDRGDEREMHRRDHAHFRAYRFFLFVAFCALLLRSAGQSNPNTSSVPWALRASLATPNFLAVSAFLLYLTLPQAILLWTEPDMEDPRA